MGHPAPLLRLFSARPPFASAEVDVVGLGRREWMGAGRVDRPRGTDDWLFMAFHQAVGIGVGTRIVEMDGPGLVIWRPSAPHLYGRDDAPWCHSWMHLSGSAVGRLVALSGLPIERPIPAVGPEDLERCVLALHEEMRSLRPDPIIAECQVRIFLHQAARRARGGVQPIAPGLVAVRMRIEEHFDEDLRLGELARLAGLSPNHLCTAFRRAFGLSPYDFALRLRLERARLLLRDRNRSIAAVAAELGYDDPASFARLIRRRLGCAPSDLR